MADPRADATSLRRRVARRSAPIAASAALVLSAVMTSGGVAAASTPGRETVAALDPALTAGRGATVNFVEQEAENAVTNGAIIGFDTTAYTLAGEASGRR